MRKPRGLVLLGAGALLGLAVASAARWAGAEAAASSCVAPKEYGGLKAVSVEGWLLFEDVQGTVRLIDSRCQVKRIVGRQ